MPSIEDPLPIDMNLNHASELMDRVRSCLATLKTGYNVQMIEDTIDLAREAYELTTEDSAHRIETCLMLVQSLGERLLRHGEDGLLDDMIKLGREAHAHTPTGHSDRSRTCVNLANSLEIRYKRTGDVGLLNEAIDLQREALDLRPTEHPDRSISCAGLASLLATRYGYTGNVILLDEAIDLAHEALELSPPGHPDRSVSCGSLARVLKVRFRRIGDVGLLDEAIDLEREALDLSPTGHPNRSISCAALGNLLMMRYEGTGDVGLLDEAIDKQREALDLRPTGHPDRSISCAGLAASLVKHYEHTSGVSLLDEAIDLEREALDLRPTGHPDRSVSCGDLAGSLMRRYERTGEVGLLDEAIDKQREALDLRPTGHPDRSVSCGNLAGLLATRYQYKGDVGLLDEAIDLHREALDLRPAGHPHRSVSFRGLAIVLMMRYERTGDVSLLDEAIDLEREVLVLRPEGHPGRTLSCADLANSLMTRYKRTGDVSLVDEAINLEREVLVLSSAGHPSRSMSCVGLANLLVIRYERTGGAALLDEAIDKQREALDLSPIGHPDRSISCGGLAALLVMCYKRTGDVGLLDEAIDLAREALGLRPAGHPQRSISCGNLATSLMERHERTDDVALLDESFALFQEAVAISPGHAVWRYSHRLATSHIQSNSPFYDAHKAILYIIESLQHDPDDTLAFVLSLSSILDNLWGCHTESKHIQLTTIYQRLVNLLPLLIHPTLGVQPQLYALKSCTQLGSDAFVNAAVADDWLIGLETLELAQGVIWSTSLHRRNPQLKDVPERLKSELQGVLKDLVITSTARPEDNEWRSFVPPRDRLHAQSSRFYAVVREIRALPGLERFMLGESFDTLRTVASGHPIVILVSARGHHYALILAPSTAKHALLSLDPTAEDERTLFSTNVSLRQSRGDMEYRVGAERAFKISATPRANALEQKLEVLWEKVVKPVIEHLELRPSSGNNHRPRLHWCPTGIFATLPLHAAGIYHGPVARRVCCADFVVSSYTPTLTTLLRAQRTTTPLKRSNLSIALIAEKRAQDVTLPVIYDVDTEIECVGVVASSRGVNIVHERVGLTTVEDTSRVMQAASIVHLACHGIQDTSDATQSGFCLGDGRLTIAKLMELKLDNAFLAFLSACETAKGDQEQPDQAMHLAAAMLFSGFKSVVATMWAISDSDGPKIAKWFYEELLVKDVVDGDSVAYALDAAVGKLRASGVPPERWAPFIHVGA